MISQEDFVEWFESPVTQHLVKILKQRLDQTYEIRAGVFCPGEPHKTQEVKAHLLGIEGELADLIEAFDEKDLSQLEEQDSEERVRNPSVRRPSSH
jgi:hypothetical protein